jgi:NAD(P)-dependent dehydrogenase (short-subunit alcohol dehydrogenase family)
MKLENTVAVVTGGASGLGLGTVANFIEGGAKVVVWDWDEALGAATAQKYAVQFIRVDVSDSASVEAALRLTLESNGTIDILVNCAGVYDFGPVLTRAPQDLQKAYARVFGINVQGTFNCCRLVAQHMASKKTQATRGVIINTSSIAAHSGSRGLAVYGASKGAILGMNLALARDLAAYKIRVNSISPGLFDTPMTHGFLRGSGKSKSAAMTLVQRLGTAGDFGHLAREIVENDYLTGGDILLDGGIRL